MLLAIRSGLVSIAIIFSVGCATSRQTNEVCRAPAGTVVTCSGVYAPTWNGPRRFTDRTSRLELIMGDSQRPADQALVLSKQDNRLIFFHLEALAGIYHDIYKQRSLGKEAKMFSDLRLQTKEVEDALGANDLWGKLSSGFARSAIGEEGKASRGDFLYTLLRENFDEGTSGKILAALQARMVRKSLQAEKALEKTLSEINLSKTFARLERDLSDAKFFSPRDEQREFLEAQISYVKDLEKKISGEIGENIEEPKVYSEKILEKGFHELRRNLRWVESKVTVFDGAFKWDFTSAPILDPELFAQYGQGPYLRMAPAAREAKSIEAYPFVLAVKYIEEIGKVKDAIELAIYTEQELQEILQDRSGAGLSEKKAVKLATRLGRILAASEYLNQTGGNKAEATVGSKSSADGQAQELRYEDLAKQIFEKFKSDEVLKKLKKAFKDAQDLL